MKPNLTVGMLWNFLIRFLRHVIAVITVKTHSPVSLKNKMPNRCVSSINRIASCIYSSIELNLTVVTLTGTLICFLRHLTAVTNHAAVTVVTLSDVSTGVFLNVRTDKFGTMKM